MDSFKLVSLKEQLMLGALGKKVSTVGAADDLSSQGGAQVHIRMDVLNFPLIQPALTQLSSHDFHSVLN